MLPLPFLIIFVFIFGLAAGSFLNVVIYRIPAGKSIVWPSSHCPLCSKPLRAWHNIPLLSYILLRGRCYYCRKPISIQYPLVEILTGACFAMVAFRFQFSFLTPVYLIFTGVLIALSGIDLRTRLLPDAITLPSALIACLMSLSTLHPVMANLWPVPPLRAFLGILTGAGPLIVIAWLYYKIRGREGLGGGDIKLMIFTGAMLGPAASALTLFLGALSGSLIGIPAALLRGGDRHVEIPFGPFLSLGAWIAALWGRSIIAWYAGFTGIPLA